MTWRLALSLVTLHAEVDAAHPDRPRGADGTIGDARHQAEQSDHNPLPPHLGVVTAWDITTADFTDDLAEDLRLLGKAGDGRVKYVIYKGRITSAVHGWEWVPYSGFSQHFDHIHLSVSDDPAQYDRTDPWQPEEDDMPLSDDDVERVADKVFERLKGYVATHGDMVTLLRGDRTHLANLTSIAKAVKVPGV